ncbi:MAG: class II fructose-bisphosphate aldolase [Saprospiraceae bacterium]
MSATHRFSPGVLYGKQAVELLHYANEKNFAIPVLTVNTTSSINAALEAAAAAGSPLALQFDHEGAAFMAGAGLSNAQHHAAVVGAVAGALYVHTMAKAYGVPVLLGTEAATPEKLPWLDGLLQAGADFFHQRGFPLFSGHKIDLSELTFEENIETVKLYLAQTAGMHMHLVVALGSAAQFAHRVDEPVDEADEFTSPEVFARAFEMLYAVSPHFTFSGLFGKMDQRRRKQTIQMLPVIMQNVQAYIKAKFNLSDDVPLLFSAVLNRDTEPENLSKAIEYGAVLVNVDAVLHDALWEGVGTFVAGHADHSSGEVDDLDSHFSNPAQWLRAGEQTLAARLGKIFESMSAVNRLA